MFSLYGEPLRPPELGTVHVETVAARSLLYDWNIREHVHRDLYQVLKVRRGAVIALPALRQPCRIPPAMARATRDHRGGARRRLGGLR